MKQTIKVKSVRGIFCLLFLLVIAAKSCTVRAQSYRLKNNYYGVSLSLGVPQQTLSSDIAQLDGLKVTFMGGSFGGVVGNNFAKVRANVGYYSGLSLPYEIDMLRGNVSANLYPLRLRGMTGQLIQPYLTAGVSQQVSYFYGNYLSDQRHMVAGATDQPLLGKVSSTQANFGVGLELQLENKMGRFLHVYAETTYGKPLSSASLYTAFAHTKVSDAMSFSIGMSFGIMRSIRQF